jgi:hypothetical protein
LRPPIVAAGQVTVIVCDEAVAFGWPAVGICRALTAPEPEPRPDQDAVAVPEDTSVDPSTPTETIIANVRFTIAPVALRAAMGSGARVSG